MREEAGRKRNGPVEDVGLLLKPMSVFFGADITSRAFFHLTDTGCGGLGVVRGG
jgi:hypothetical protein